MPNKLRDHLTFHVQTLSRFDVLADIFLYVLVVDLQSAPWKEQQSMMKGILQNLVLGKEYPRTDHYSSVQLQYHESYYQHLEELVEH